MNPGKILMTSCVLLCTFFQGQAKEKDFLEECKKKQIGSLDQEFLALTIDETRNTLYHSFEPWQYYMRKTNGTVFINSNRFLKIDTLNSKKGKRISKTQYGPEELLLLDFGDTLLSDVTKNDFSEQSLGNSRYSPITLIQYFYSHGAKEEKENPDNGFAVYKLNMNKTIVKLFINRTSCILDKITTLNDDDLYGDVLNTIYYKDYSSESGIDFPKTIFIEKKNGKAKDTVVVSSAHIVHEVTPLLIKPAGFKWTEEKKEMPEEYVVEKFNDHIHFLNFKNADSKVMIVEFSDFLVVAEAPLNSKNGEMIIQEAKKIASSKPIRYFVFGHFHPWYLGGVRPFIHIETTILSTHEDIPYVDYLANAPHTLTPDNLQLEPKKLKIEELKDSLTISDGKFEMQIFVIGKKSDHTSDYKIYYFRSEKLLFEDDLAWIKKECVLQKAGSRQAGLYNSMKELNLKVDTIIQSWPIGEQYNIKSVIPFHELEESISIK